jgi:hypothetical protein
MHVKDQPSEEEMKMSDETSESKLTINDPVDQETLTKFSQLQTARLQLSERLLDLEMEKVRTIRAATQVDTERQRLFETVLLARGLAPNAPVEVDAKTGIIKSLLTSGPPSDGGAGNVGFVQDTSSSRPS